MQRNLSSKIKSWIKKNKVIDVILFGSSARGKSKPHDSDLCILINDFDEKKTLDLIDSLAKINSGFHVSIITSSAFVKGDTLTKTLLNEGISIKSGKKYSNLLGFDPKSMFIYSLKNFSPSKRVKFHYLLKGRYGMKGILKEVNGKFIGTGTIIISIEKEDILKSVFDSWEVSYNIVRILVG